MCYMFQSGTLYMYVGVYFIKCILSEHALKEFLFLSFSPF